MLSLHLLCHMRVVVPGVVPTLCVPLSILPQSVQGIPLVNRRQLTLPRRVIIMYLLIAPRYTYLRPVLVLDLDRSSHHLQIYPKYPCSVILVSLLFYWLGQGCSQSVATKMIFSCWYLSCSASLYLFFVEGDIFYAPPPLLALRL